jgi:hypothetical protein
MHTNSVYIKILKLSLQLWQCVYIYMYGFILPICLITKQMGKHSVRVRVRVCFRDCVRVRVRVCFRDCVRVRVRVRVHVRVHVHVRVRVRVRSERILTCLRHTSIIYVCQCACVYNM